jgi:hypothetical protein
MGKNMKRIHKINNQNFPQGSSDKTQPVSWLIKSILFALLFILTSHVASANNISVANVSLTGRNTTDHYIMVKFDINWENSWRTSTAPNNWDAAWVFVKYKVSGNYVSSAGATASGTTITVGSTTGLRVGMLVSVTAGTGAFNVTTVVTSITDAATFEVSAAPVVGLSGGAVVTGYAFWNHATLNLTGYTAPAGSTITPASDGTGIFIYRSSDGTGTNTFSNAQLRWNYGVNGVTDGVSVDIEVFAIEMVYVTQGSFYVGSGGTESFSFTAANNTSGATVPFQITSTAPILQGNNIGSSASNLSARGDWDLTATTTDILATGFPTGYSAFYCMKYEIMQQQYVDFLNMLTRNQQATKVTTPVSSGITSVTNRYVMPNSLNLINRNGIRCDATLDATAPITFYCDLNGNGIGGETDDGQDIACDFLGWPDVAAYLDWSGLRPMTELEFEKSCRGPLAPVPGEYAWGTSGIASNLYTLSDSGSASEDILTNYNKDYVSSVGASSSGTTTITAGSTTGLIVGMPVSVTAGTGVFAAGTVVTAITDATTFEVSVAPVLDLSGGAVVTGYTIWGNASYYMTSRRGNIDGPMRVGIFAGTNGNNNDRVTAGATYYGIMEMSGNVWERPVTVGNVAGRSFTGLHGDGILSIDGYATVDYWPGINGNNTTTTANTNYLGVTGVVGGAGSGFRGGDWWPSYLLLLVSARDNASQNITTREFRRGGRGVRTAPL